MRTDILQQSNEKPVSSGEGGRLQRFLFEDDHDFTRTVAGFLKSEAAVHRFVFRGLLAVGVGILALAVTMVAFGQVPKVTVRLVVPAGNVDEGRNEVWLADLTGRMLREGTLKRPADALARDVAAMGGELGVGVGADRTNITTDVLSERGPDAARLIAEVAREPRLPESELARVKSSLSRDLAMQKSTAQAQALEKFNEMIYGDHPYGRLFPTEAMLAGYTIDQVRTFHKARYGAARSRLYVAGVFDPAAMEQAIRGAFGDWAGTATTAAAPSGT
jgi:predicted Zn-dependent peptidase